jgi:hypothetical protein
MSPIFLAACATCMPISWTEVASSLDAAVTVCTLAVAWPAAAATVVVCCALSPTVEDIHRAAPCISAAAEATPSTDSSKQSAKDSRDSRRTSSLRAWAAICCPVAVPSRLRQLSRGEGVRVSGE